MTLKLVTWLAPVQSECCDPFGIEIRNQTATPGALLRSDLGLEAGIPSGSSTHEKPQIPRTRRVHSR